MIAVATFLFALPCREVAGGTVANQPTARPISFSVFGSWDGVRVMAALIRQYENDRQAHFIRFTPTLTEQVLGMLSGGQCDVGMALDSRLPEASRDKVGHFQSFTLGRFVVAVGVNAKNHVRTITLDDLRSVLTARTEDWRDVNGSGNSAQIEICPPSDISTAWMIYRKNVLLRCPLGHTILEPCARPQHEKKSDAEVVGAIIKQSNAIGFFLYGCEEPLDPRIRILRIAADRDSEAVPPSPSTVADGRYPLIDTLTLYLCPDAPAEALEFCKFATGPQAATIVKQFSLWPGCELDQTRAQQRLAEVKTGRGTEIAACDLTGLGNALTDLSLEFVKAKAAVQLKFHKGEMPEEAVENLAKGVTELLLADKGSAQGPVVGPNQKSPNPKSIELGRMEAGIVVHPENPLPSLPLEEVRSILCGETKKWPAVRGAAAAMHVFGLKRGDPITKLLKEKLFESEGRRSLKYTAQPDNEKVILAVARDPAAIGFVDLSQLPPKEKSVKLVPVFEGTKTGSEGPKRNAPHPDPLPTNLRSVPGEGAIGLSPPNPLSRTLTLYVSPKAGQAAKDFAAFLTPEHCKETIARYNLLPPLQTEQPELASRPPFGPLPADAPSADMDGSVALAVGLAPVLDDPDAPQSQGAKNAVRVKSRKLLARSDPVMAVPEQPATPEATADSQPVPEKKSEPQPMTHGTPGLSDEQALWLAGAGVVGGILAAIGVGWLGSPRRKRVAKGKIGAWPPP
jgi:ABC-type phosphate transport system substrate-binding protein